MKVTTAALFSIFASVYRLQGCNADTPSMRGVHAEDEQGRKLQSSNHATMSSVSENQFRVYLDIETNLYELSK